MAATDQKSVEMRQFRVEHVLEVYTGVPLNDDNVIRGGEFLRFMTGRHLRGQGETQAALDYVRPHLAAQFPALRELDPDILSLMRPERRREEVTNWIARHKNDPKLAGQSFLEVQGPNDCFPDPAAAASAGTYGASGQRRPGRLPRLTQ